MLVFSGIIHILFISNDITEVLLADKNISNLWFEQ